MGFHYFIGIDISKKTLDLSVLKNNQKVLYKRIDNQSWAIDELLNELKKLDGFTMQTALFCMEHTGIYSNFLLDLLHQNEANIWLVHGLHIKQFRNDQR